MRIQAIRLQEITQGIDHPLSYYSRNLTTIRSIIQLVKAFALLSTLQHFDVYLSAAVVPVEVFHKPCTTDIHTHNEEQNPGLIFRNVV